MIKQFLAAVFCAGLVAIEVGCPQQAASPSPQVPQDTAWCKRGCDALMLLKGRDGQPGCEEARTLEMPSGEMVTCEQFCKQTQDAGRNLYPSCWVEAKTCSDIEEFRKRATPCQND